MTLLKLLKWSVSYIKIYILSLHRFGFSFLLLDLVTSLSARGIQCLSDCSLCDKRLWSSHPLTFFDRLHGKTS